MIAGVKNRKAIILFAVLTLAMLCVIFGNSSLPREDSAAMSSRIVRWVKPILDPRGHIAPDTFHHYIRKLAHFTEFAALGFCLMGLSGQLLWRKKAYCVLAPTVLSAITAATDETIQIFSPERGPGLKDVLLDCSGAFFGLACMLLALCVLKKVKMKT